MLNTRNIDDTLKAKAQGNENFLTILAQDEANVRENAKKEEAVVDISFNKLQQDDLSKLFISTFNSPQYGIKKFEPAGKECKVTLENGLSFSVKVETSTDGKKDKFTFTSDKSNRKPVPDGENGQPKDALLEPDHVKLFVLMFKQTRIANGRKYPTPIFIKISKPNPEFERALRAAFIADGCKMLNENPQPPADAPNAAKKEPAKGAPVAPTQNPAAKGNTPAAPETPASQHPDLPDPRPDDKPKSSTKAADVPPPPPSSNRPKMG